MLLTVEEARQHISTTLADDVLRRLLDDAEEAIDDEAGPLVSDALASVTEVHRVNGPLIVLFQRAASITSVLEGTTTLAADDYALGPNLTALRRLDTGTNPAAWWRKPTTVTYARLAGIARREMAQVELVRLVMSFNPQLAATTIGPWTESYRQGRPYPDQRADILATVSGAFEGIR